MSFSWSIKKIKDYESLCWLPIEAWEKWADTSYRYASDDTVKINPITDALVWATSHVGMHSITEKNWEKFANRMLLYQAATGQGLVRYGLGDVYVTRADVQRHIGLSTNASSMTDAEFLQWMAHVVTQNEFRTAKITKKTLEDLAKYRDEKRAEYEAISPSEV